MDDKKQEVNPHFGSWTVSARHRTLTLPDPPYDDLDTLAYRIYETAKLFVNYWALLTKGGAESRARGRFKGAACKC